MKKFDLQELLQMQEALDQVIFKKSNVEKREDVINNIELALRVELGELANEWQGFKYWKSNKKINREKMIEELADCMHFALSLDLYYIKKENQENSINMVSDYIENLEENYKKCSDEITLNLFLCIYNYLDKNEKAGIVIGIFQLGYSLGFSLEEMVQAYKSKRDINFKRVSEGY